MVEVGEEALGWFTVAEVAQILRLAEVTVRRRIKAGELEHVKDGRAVRITRQQLQRYQQQRLEKASTKASTAA